MRRLSVGLIAATVVALVLPAVANAQASLTTQSQYTNTANGSVGTHNWAISLQNHGDGTDLYSTVRAWWYEASGHYHQALQAGQSGYSATSTTPPGTFEVRENNTNGLACQYNQTYRKSERQPGFDGADWELVDTVARWYDKCAGSGTHYFQSVITITLPSGSVWNFPAGTTTDTPTSPDAVAVRTRVISSDQRTMTLTVTAPAAGLWFGNTTTPTNVMDDAVNLHGKVLAPGGDELATYWFEYKFGAAWIQLPPRDVPGPRPTRTTVLLTEKLRPNCEEVDTSDGPCTPVSATGPVFPFPPSTHYVYRLCVRTYRLGTTCHDSTGTRDGTQYDAFRTLEPWDETEQDETVTCATSPSPSPPPGACYQPPGPSTLSHTPYAFHRTNIASLQVLFFNPLHLEIWGNFHHGRNVVFGTRPWVGQIWQSAEHINGPALRYDFQMKIYRRTLAGRDRVVDSFQDTVPNPPAFSSSGEDQSRSWFVPHYSEGPYRVRFLLIVRSSGRPNPNTADGRWVLVPRTTTPWYRCEEGAGDVRHCKFPD
jgi:hypothetical protein